jgi:hypothetical protein
MHDCGTSCIDCAEAARDCRVNPIRITDPFAMRTECAGDVDEAPLLVPPCGSKLGQERVTSMRSAVGIHSLNRGLHGLPAAVVENDGEDRQPILLRHGVDGIRRGEVESAVADDLHHPAGGIRQPEAKRHAAAEAKPPTGEAHIGPRLGATKLLLKDGRIADGFIEDDVILRQERL